MNINQLQDELIEDFSFFEDWMQKYDFIIQFAKELPIIDDQYKVDEYKIKGCQSQVWLKPEQKDGIVYFKADSDALITKGLVSLMIKVLSGHSAEDIAKADLYFIDKIGLKDHLSPTRANGLLSMVKQMKLYAIALSAQNKAAE
ncbi:MAG TPA: SufE family protein [Candidatus Sphingobacterium stercoripullorum]|uniref:SufE family protein n=1 Tax=Candidatus Sphingobacterium stercoripullorum TaxID=2838759 RepID=A0A9D1W8Z9_9SPHI|nr:SufE family protein [Candidatus Sphingobacterium stercoripullorum]HLR50532.1 SufE family protein [Candidatus Sphingobacterium stercoripullorum]